MKPAVLPIVCGAALAIMAGAVSTHYLSVRQLITLAENSELPTGSLDPTFEAGSGTEALIAQFQQENASLQGRLADSRSRLQSPHASAPAQTGNKLDILLSELVAQNRDLRNQVAETNRDLMELQFQVNTHSEEFRPLNITEEEIPNGDEFDPTAIGVLPPLDIP